MSINNNQSLKIHPRTPAPPPTDPHQSRAARNWLMVTKKFKAFGFNWHPFSIDDELPLHKHTVFWWPIVFFLGWALLLTKAFWCLCWPNPSDYEVLLNQLGFPVFIASSYS